MAPTPVNLTTSGAGPKSLPPLPPAPPAAPPAAPAPAPPRPRYPPTQPAGDIYGYQYHAPYEYAVNPPPVQRKAPPIPPYPGTEHLYNYPVDPMITKDGDVVIPPGPPMGPPMGPPGGAAIVVRAEEALLVLLVLVLWVAAIALFFNRWGKIRMLEPYQPKFQQHRQSCALVDISGTTQVKSAMDLQTLVLSEHEPALAASTSSMLPACSVSPSMRRASHVPLGSVRHHASFSHASFSEGPSCSHRGSVAVGVAGGPERLSSNV